MTQFERQEQDRKDRFLNLMEQLQQEKRFDPQELPLKYGFYDRIFRGVLEVARVGKASLHLRKENGRPLVLMANSEIVKYAKRGDQLGATVGRRFGQWHLIHIQLVGSYVDAQNGETMIHLSVSRMIPPNNGVYNGLV